VVDKGEKQMSKEFEEALAIEIAMDESPYTIGLELCNFFYPCRNCPAGDSPEIGCDGKIGEMTREWAEGVKDE
jgi:hypothetical protein